MVAVIEGFHWTLTFCWVKNTACWHTTDGTALVLPVPGERTGLTEIVLAPAQSIDTSSLCHMPGSVTEGKGEEGDHPLPNKQGHVTLCGKGLLIVHMRG